MKAMMWYLVGRVALSLWLDMDVVEQVDTVQQAGNAFMEKMSCQSIILQVGIIDKEVIIIGQCIERKT